MSGWSGKVDLTCRQFCQFSLGSRFPNSFEFSEWFGTSTKVFFRIDHDRKAVKGDGELKEVDLCQISMISHRCVRRSNEDGGHLGVAEHGAPFAEGQVGGDDQRDALVEFADQMEQERTAIRREGQVGHRTNRARWRLGLLSRQFARCPARPARLFGVELIHQIGDAVKRALLAG